MAENNVSPEEQAEEMSAQAEVKEDEVRTTIINDFGFDEATDKDKIDKLTAKEVENRKRLTKAIGQKVKYRTDAQKAQEKLNANQPNQPAPVPTSSVDVEETILRANGMEIELLKQLKDIATLRKSSLIDAQKDPLFIMAKERFEKDQKSKDASVGASRGSGSRTASKDAATPGLTRDEHKEIWKQKTGFSA